MTTISKLASEIVEQSEQRRRLMSPIIAQIARQAEIQQKLMTPFVEMMRSHAEMQKNLTQAIAEPLRRQEELRRNLLSSTFADISRMQEARNKLINPILSAIASQQQAHKRLMAPFIAELGRQERLRKELFFPVAEQLARHARIQNAIIAQFTQQTEMHRKLFEPSRNIIRQFESLRSLKLDLLDEAFRTLADEPSETIADEDVSAVTAVVNQPGFGELSIVEQINRLIEAVKELKTSTARTILLTIVTTLLTLFLTDCYTKVKEHFFGPEPPKVIVREIQSIVKDSQIDETSIREYRIICQRSVAVQQNRRPKSPRVGFLTAGDIVHLLTKQGPWCLIEWHDEAAGNVVQGWVRSKYLKQMSK